MMDIKIVWQSIRMLIWMTILTGLIYPGLITLLANLFFHDQATGSLLFIDGKPRGSKLIAQKFSSDRYFWPRPSAVDFNPLSSGGSNLGPTSNILKNKVEERTQFLLKFGGSNPGSIPADLLFASGSGLDPHISLHAAYFQMDRIAKTRSISKEKVRELIDHFLERPTLRVMGNHRINVLMLNHFLDAHSQKDDKHE